MLSANVKRRRRPSPEAGDAPALRRGLQMLELLAEQPSGLLQTEIAERLDAPDSSIMRIGAVLEEMRYVTRPAETRRYQLTRKLLALARGRSEEYNLVETALPVMRRLRDELREVVLLGVLAPELGMGITLAMARAKYPFAFQVELGAPFHLHASGPGKAMLAALTDAERDAVLPRLKLEQLTARTIVTPRQLRAELDRVRQQGYAVDNEEYFDGCVCVGAAIPRASELPVYALWVTGPSTRFSARHAPQIAPQLIAAAQELGGQHE